MTGCMSGSIESGPGITVVISPRQASVNSGQMLTFSATVSGTKAGQSNGVTWSVQEATGGSVNGSGSYSAPTWTGTFHVVATSVADTSKQDTATVQVTSTGVSVSISPSTVVIQPNASFTFTATVTGLAQGQSTAVTWTVQEGTSGGTVDGSGKYTAPANEGNYHLLATSVADSSKSAIAMATVNGFTALSADRRTLWNPGVSGGIPARTTICATVNASTYGNGTQDASGGIQTALNACPEGQVVQLSAGIFTINNNFLLISRGITLRGAGATSTTLQRTNGATPHNPTAQVTDPVVIIGPNRWPSPDDSTSQTLTADGAKGAYSVAVVNGSGFAAGQFVLLDEDDYNTGSWTSLPNRGGAPTTVTIWASDRAVFQRHNPSDPNVDDPFPGSLTWFSRSGRPVNEIKEVASVSGNTITFTTPLHISYRASHAAQLTRYTGNNVHVKNAGLESLKVIGGGDGNVRFEAAAYSWMKDVEDTIWLGEGVAIDNSFRIEVRGSYIHDTAWPVPGGSGYAISFAAGSSEALIEDNIVLKANKMMVARSSGTASVVGYNYMDDGFIDYVQTWQEVGLNGSHMVGSHHMLFEGNESFNYDADCTHGNAIYHTVFRNHLSGFRRDYPEDPLSGNQRAGGLEYGAWWHSFIGNVMGTEGRMSGWGYEDPGTAPGPNPWQDGRFIWRLGYDPAHWEQVADPMVQGSVLRHGNFDYVSSSVHWDPSTSERSIPASLYLTHRPTVFDSGRGYVWPWVDATGATKLATLPAKARYDAGTPFVQP